MAAGPVIKRDVHKLPQGMQTYLAGRIPGISQSMISIYQNKGLYNPLPDPKQVYISPACYQEVTERIQYYHNVYRYNKAFIQADWVAKFKEREWVVFMREVQQIYRAHAQDTPVSFTTNRTLKKVDLAMITNTVLRGLVEKYGGRNALADQIGCAVTTLSYWINGTTLPKQHAYIKRLEELAEMPIHDIFPDANYIKKVEEPTRMQLHQDYQEEYKKLPTLTTPKSQENDSDYEYLNGLMKQLNWLGLCLGATVAIQLINAILSTILLLFLR